jgi:hypothetical protein
MKQILILAAALFITLAGFSNKITLVRNGGNWTTNSSWSPSRLPANGDTIVIPTGYTVTLQSHITLSGVIMMISGTLNLDNGQISLDINSRILLLTNTSSILTQGNAEYVKIGAVTKLQGNGNNASAVGIAFADNTTGSAPALGFSFSILPVEFSSFYATKSGNTVLLSWTTAQESGNSFFEIQKSTDGQHFQVIASVQGAGNSSSPREYSFTDQNLNAATTYYRIRQVDNNGLSVYTSVRTVRANGTAADTRVYNIGKNLNVEFNTRVQGSFSIRVLNMNGQLIANQSYQQPAYRITLNLAQAASGAYIVQVIDANGLAESSKIVL